MTEPVNPPIKEFRAGNVKSAIWRNEAEQDGRTVVQHSVKIQKQFQVKQTSEWRSTDYFYPQDIPKLILVAQKAFEFVTLKQNSEGGADESIPE